MAIEWTDDLDTGIDLIDNQHRRIVDFINQLEAAVAQRDSAMVEQVLHALAEYCVSHFAFEESLQERAGYKFAGPHKAIHEMFARRLAKYRDRHLAGEDVGQALYDMLSAWLVQHIKRDDMDYVPEVKRCVAGVKRVDDGSDWLSRAVAGFFGTAR